MSAKLRLIYKTAQESTGKTAADVTELSFKRYALKKTVIKNWGDSLFYLILRRSRMHLLSLIYFFRTTAPPATPVCFLSPREHIYF